MKNRKKEGVRMEISQDWLEKYEKVKDILVSPVDFGELFNKEEVKGKKLFILNMGEVNFPTGSILVRDPLVYLHRREQPYIQKVPVGVFPIDTLVVKIEEDHYRYVATRVRFSDEKAIVYRNALQGNENLENINENSFFGFYVDAGLATIVDVKTRDKYCDFEEEWCKVNPDGNIYDDFFADEFKKNYKINPKFQREAGDWINFALPNTNLSIPMIQSGFGDGEYPVYFGYDKDGKVCEVIIEYIYAGE